LLCSVVGTVYTMKVEDDTSTIPTFSELPTTTDSSDTSNSMRGDPYHYAHGITNPDTGSTLTVDIATDGHNWAMGLSYNPTEVDNYNECSGSALEPKETADFYNEEEIASTHDSYTDSVLDSNMQDKTYWQRQQRNIQNDRQNIEARRATNNIPINTLWHPPYSLDPCIEKVQNTLASEQCRTKLRKMREEIQATISILTRKNHRSRRQVAFIDMALDGTLVAKLMAVQNGDIEVAQKILQELRQAWPWEHKGSFIVRWIKIPESKFMGALGGDIIKEVETYIASRKDFQRSHEINMSSFHAQCLQRQFRGDVKWLQQKRDAIIQQLDSKKMSDDLRLKCELVSLNIILNDQATNIFFTIAHKPLTIARAELLSLQEQVCQFYREYNVISRSQATATMQEQHGFDLLAAGQACFQDRSDYNPKVEFASSDVRTLIFTTITDGTLQQATAELQYFEEQLDDHFAQYQMKPEEQTAYMIAHHGYDVRAIARALYKSRSDYAVATLEPSSRSTDLPQMTAASYTVHSNSTKMSGLESQQGNEYRSLPVSAIPPEIRSVRAGMVEALNQSKSQVQLANNCEALLCEVFGLARQHNYEIHPEVQSQVHTSIGIIRITEYTHELVFHVAVVDRVLSDIQIQAVPEMAQQASLLERSPALLVHGLKTFVTGLNPITQVKGLCELLVSTAHFACDMTIGKLYLSPAAYQARIDGFWDTMDALSPENLAQLSAEHWVELAANMAAGVVVGVGAYKTITYLKEIEATSRVARQAAKIAGGLKGAVDTILAEHPVAVTAEGVLISNYEKIEEAAEKVVSVVKDSQTLLEVAAENTMLLQNTMQTIGGCTSEEIRLILNDSGPLIKNLIDGSGKLIKGFRAENTISYYIEHAFSADHIKSGLLKAGTKSEIVKNVLETISSFDRLGELQMGGNQIRIVMNNVDITIRVHIKDSLLYSFDIMQGHTPRIIGHLIDAVGK